MGEIDFIYECPKCGTEYCGEMDSNNEEYVELISCEECGHKYTLFVNIEINVQTRDNY